MPRIVRRSVRKPRKVYRKRAKVARRLGRAKYNRNIPEYASLSCKRSLAGAGGGNFLLGNLYNLMNTTLD